jgi:hypothetical protein
LSANERKQAGSKENPAARNPKFEISNFKSFPASKPGFHFFLIRRRSLLYSRWLVHNFLKISINFARSVAK